MSEATNHIYQPEAPALDLYPVLEGAKIQYDCQNIANLTEGDSPLALENQRRYESLTAGGESFTSVSCYLSKEGWTVDLRDYEKEDEGFTPAARDRVIKELQGSVGETVRTRLEDIKSPWWQSAVRDWESRGLAVAAVTKDNPYGYYAAEVDETLGKAIRPVGWGLERKRVTGINVTNTGQPMLSRPAEPGQEQDKGLNHMPAHNMALTMFKDDEWSPTFIVPSGDVALNITNNTGIQYAQSVFEGAVANLSEDGKEVTLFRPRENAERIVRSIVAAGGPEIDPEQVLQSIMATVMQNKGYFKRGVRNKLYIRPCIFGTKGGTGANAAKEYIFSVEVFPFGDYFSGAIAIEGRTDLHRPATGSDKMATNYGPMFNDKKATKGRTPSSGEGNYADFLSFDVDGNVEEVTSCAFFAVKKLDGKIFLITPPVRGDEKGEGKNILPSINRKSVIEIAERLGIEVIVRDIPRCELDWICGAFTTGTAAGITRVGLIDIKNRAEDVVDPEDRHYNNFEDPYAAKLDDPEATELIDTLYNRLMEARAGTLSDPRLVDLNDEWVVRRKLR
jgi:branched-chain amino acid aminotransferase